jgi:hypothetical protein
MKNSWQLALNCTSFKTQFDNRSNDPIMSLSFT